MFSTVSQPMTTEECGRCPLSNNNSIASVPRRGYVEWCIRVHRGVWYRAPTIPHAARLAGHAQDPRDVCKNRARNLVRRNIRINATGWPSARTVSSPRYMSLRIKIHAFLAASRCPSSSTRPRPAPPCLRRPTIRARVLGRVRGGQGYLRVLLIGWGVDYEQPRDTWVRRDDGRYLAHTCK